MSIRDLQWADMPSLVEGYWAMYDEVRDNPDLGIGLYAAKPSLSEEADWFVRLFKQIQEGTTVAAVAEADGKAVGLCSVARSAPIQDTRHIGVLGIHVALPYRRRGLGRGLMEYTIERCRGRFEQIELTVFKSNAGARTLYESLGFKTWGVEPKGVLRAGGYTDLEHMILFLK